MVGTDKEMARDLRDDERVMHQWPLPNMGTDSAIGIFILHPHFHSEVQHRMWRLPIFRDDAGYEFGGQDTRVVP